MKVFFRKSMSILLSLMFVVGIVLTGTSSFIVSANAPSGIKNNGLYGINIDINASPYTDSTFCNGYQYSNVGCAWFASARVKQLSGKGTQTYGASNWWNNGNGRYGFETYSNPIPYSVVCYGESSSSPYGHVLIIEKEVDDCYIVSEGGAWKDGVTASNGYCRIGIIGKDRIKSYLPNYLGCVCFNEDPTGAVDEISSKSPGTVFVRGWAIDFDFPYDNIPVHVYIGEGSSEECHVVQTGKTRTDIGYGNTHGFEETITTSKTGTQTVRIYAINSPYGNNPLIDSGSVTISNPDTTKPTCSISSTNNVAASQTVTLSISDNVGLAGYYWGTNPSYSSNTYSTVSGTSMSVTKSVSSSGTYYLTVKDSSGNISSTDAKVFYKTTLDANGGSVSPANVVTMSGNSFKLPTPAKSGYTFLGWALSSNATSAYYQPGSSFSVKSSSTLYAVWKSSSSPSNPDNPTPSSQTVNIKNFTDSRTESYRTTITFTAETANAPAGSSVHWFIDGNDAGTGETYTVKQARSSFTVQAKLLNSNGLAIAESGIEKVNIKTGFWAKLVAFFRNLFSRLPVIVQTIEEDF